MTKPKVGGTNHRWLVEDTQSLLIELAGHHKAVIENLRREHLSNAALELAQAGQTLVALQRMLGQMQLLIASGEATPTERNRAHEHAQRARRHHRDRQTENRRL